MAELAVSDELVRSVRRSVMAGLEARARQSPAQESGGDHERVLAHELVRVELARLADEAVRAGRPPLPAEVEDELASEVWASLYGFGPFERYLAMEDVENIVVNGYDIVWLYFADGRVEQGASIGSSNDDLRRLIQRAAARMGRNERRFDDASPMLDLQLRDGSRLHAITSVTTAPCVTIRRHRHLKVTLADLAGLGTVDDTLVEFLAAAVRARLNILVVGGTDAGKTTFLRALISEIPSRERLVIVEDDAELSVIASGAAQRNVVEMEARRANTEGIGAITIADLVREARRMRPDRLIVGEVRGAEVIQMLDAMSMGNDGSLGTLHADSTRTAFSKIGEFALRSAERLPLEASALMVANSLHLVVHVHKPDRMATTRVVSSVREVAGSEAATVLSNEVFAPDSTGRARPAHPLQASTMDRLIDAGFDPTLLQGSGRW